MPDERGMSIVSLARSALSPVERLTGALLDAQRREWTASGVVIAYVVIWTVYATLSKGGQDVHPDIGELVARARAPALGYANDPPLAAWVAGLWFTIFPRADWAAYLLSMTAVGIGLWVAWRLFARWLDGEKRIAALALLTLIPLLNFHALRFSSTVVIVPLWALTILWFLRSFETWRASDAALAGACAAAALLGNYWSVYLVAGLAGTALLDHRRWSYLRSAAPWVTIGMGLVVLAPHGIWLITHDHPPLRYALGASFGGVSAQAARTALHYLGGAAAYAAVPVAFAILAARPSRPALVDMAWPETAERRFAAIVFWLPLLLPVLVTLFTGGHTTSVWTMAAWTLFPVVLLSSPLVTISAAAASRAVAVAIAFPLAMVAAAPIVALAAHRKGVADYGGHYRELAGAVEREWRQVSRHPLRLIGGEYYLVRGTAFYLADQPLILDNAISFGKEIDRARIESEGIALVCPVVDVGCTLMANAYAAREPSARGTTIRLVRSYFGFAGTPERYLIVVVPGRS
jgi:4-amino-4-deoxy-L-arabinose transferase-like glycosyltransferase